jgi:uncharacterized membrane protein required for colicin V production
MNTIDILFLVTIALLVFNGLRNGAVVSLIHLLTLPVAFLGAAFFGSSLTNVLAANHLPANPLISYAVLFLGIVLVLHVIGSSVRRGLHAIPLVGAGDRLIGAGLGFVEAWLLWVVLLALLHNFLQGANSIPGIGPSLFQSWQQAYDSAVSQSLFAHVNSAFVHTLHQ